MYNKTSIKLLPFACLLHFDVHLHVGRFLQLKPVASGYSAGVFPLVMGEADVLPSTGRRGLAALGFPEMGIRLGWCRVVSSGGCLVCLSS